MKNKSLFIFTMLLFIPFLLYAGQERYPARSSKYISDYAGVIGNGDRELIELMLKRFEEKTGIEASVLTVRSSYDYTAGVNGSEGLASEVFEKWGVGNRKTNDGILVLVATDDHELKIELGKALSGTQQYKTHEIIYNLMIPYFRDLQYGRGIFEGVRGITQNFKPEIAGIDPLYILIIFIAILAATAAFLILRVAARLNYLSNDVENAGSPVSEKETYGGGAVGNW
jgi:uncharacterized membrane protein YgcG